MLIPSIDLKNGKVVQLIQGKDQALETSDVDGWIEKFQYFPKIQLIDLDAALGTGSNTDLLHYICAKLPCRVGGGINSVLRAKETLSAGATHVIVGSALFQNGQPNLDMAQTLSKTVGRNHIIAAVDSREGQVVVKGWKSTVPITAVEAVSVLEPYCEEFLYTHVDTEGLMTGIDMEAVLNVKRATKLRLVAAGGISTHEEISKLDKLGVDAVVGMAIYTGALSLEKFRRITKKYPVS